MYFLTSNNLSKKSVEQYSHVLKFFSSSPFGDYNVDFWLQTNSVKVNSIYFSVFNILRMI